MMLRGWRTGLQVRPQHAVKPQHWPGPSGLCSPALPGRRKQGLVGPSTPTRKPHPCCQAALCLSYLHSQVSVDIVKRALAATLDSQVPTNISTSIIQGAPNGATVWFTTVCALSVALAALTFNLFSILAQLQVFTTTKSEQKRQVLYGVDVTNSRFFQDERVLAAVEFAAQAHVGQVRKTGEPYVSHCLETALIVEHNLPPASEYERYALAIIAALLHDVVDDTPVDLSAIKAKFGASVASMVSQVSKLSQMNQLLRRGKRKGWAEYSPQHFKALRKMIVDMVFEEPLVILIKLADRLHNMRTVFVLKPDKQQAVAEETLEVWCTMADCLGWDGLKSEMEDLCFAVLQPKEYCTLRAQLDRIWSLPSLKVVVDAADSSSLPANALAPAPPLTIRGRRAAAAAAARKAAAAAKAAVQALALPPLPAALTDRAALPLLPMLDPHGRNAANQSKDNNQSLDLDLGIRIVSSSEPGPQTVVSSWDDVALGKLQAPLASSSSPAAALTGYGEASSTVEQLTAASVASFVAADADMLQAVTVNVGGDEPVAEGVVGNRQLNGEVQLLAESMHKLSGSSGSTGWGSDSSSSSSVHTSDQSSSSMLRAGMSSTNTMTVGSSSSSSSSRGVGSTSTATLTLPAPGVSLDTSAALEAQSASKSASASSTSTWARPTVTYTSLMSADELEDMLTSARSSSVQPATVLYTREQLQAGGDRARAARGGGQEEASASGSADPSRDSSSGVRDVLSDAQLVEQQERLRSLISTVVPFDSVNFKDTRSLAISTRRGLEVLDQCAELLYNEVTLRSAGGGLGLQIQGRLKSLYSVYKKMVRKGCSVAEVYDARALRVIVGDDGGARTRDAVETCYKLVSAVHSIWKPIPQEFDDYIANPKPSGYQALHTAVRGPGGIPMEIQIKTASMHELAEYGAAAHWVYKEYSNSSVPLPITPLPSEPSPSLLTRPTKPSPLNPPARPSASDVTPAPASDQLLPEPPFLALPSRLKNRGWAGQPVLRVSKDKLRYGVVVCAHNEGKKLMVAVRAGPTAAEYPIRVPDYGFYRGLIDYVESKGWNVPGHSDFNIRLEEFVLATNGRYHRKDHMGYVQPAEVLTLLEGYEEDADSVTRARAAAAWQARAAAGETQPAAPASITPERLHSPPAFDTYDPTTHLPAPTTLQQHGSSSEGERLQEPEQVEASPPPPVDPTAERIRRQMQEAYLRTQQLRTMIEWGRSAMGRYCQGGSEPGDEVSVIIWPGGTIEHLPRGATVADVVRSKGIITLNPLPEPPDIRPSATAIAGGDDGWLAMYSRQSGNDPASPPVPLVNVNNRLVPESHVLNDGDLVILTREKVKI